ncbi:MAG: aldo/keto reductase [Candidatus Omnitrophica bacterium]|nr:aldo/keto reductase [Candidatus Omnitrophota bacterium]MBU1808947.1 aldo/keto reductase [Candidatus Omnitrophota bacterium]
MTKIALGTAQFGMDYGVNNKRGKVAPEEAFRILHRAATIGIDTVDTAYSYGESEEVIGGYLSAGKSGLKVISKLPACSHSDVRGFFDRSLGRLGVSKLFGYLVHGFKAYQDDEAIWAELEKLKLHGKVEKIGFSLYSPSELEQILKRDLAVDLVQLPLSVFDQRFVPYLSAAKKRGIDIHARSVFLQGLVFTRPDELDTYFRRVRDNIDALHSLSMRMGASIASLCINFVAAYPHVDKIVVGVDSEENLEEIIGISRGKPLSQDDVSKISRMRIDDDAILLPFHWKLSKVRV